MRKLLYIFSFLAIFLSFEFLSCAGVAFAKTDLSLSESDLSFSKDVAFDGETVRIFARIFNVGDTDVYGYVAFSSNGKQMADPQPVSIRSNTYDDVFIDYKFKAGLYNITAEIVKESPADEGLSNNKAEKKDYFVDLDTDSDGVGDSGDPDIDGDGLANDEEKNIGTDPLAADTDGDGIGDKVDIFPFNKAESRDTDGDGIGDNEDADIDGDGLINNEEIYKYGTNPSSQDTDGDKVLDSNEIEDATDPNKQDSDGDGAIDSEDAYPLDSSKWQAGLLGSIAGLFKGKEYLYLIIGIFALAIFALLFRRKK